MEADEKRAQQKAQSVGDDPEFHGLLDRWHFLVSRQAKQKALAALIAYIDGRTAGAAPAGWQLVPKKLPPEVVDAIASASYDLDDTAREIVREDWTCSLAIIGDQLAAPSPQQGKEGGN
jgi:hypothetical protein